MSDTPTYRFAVTVNRDPDAPSVAVDDLTTGSARTEVTLQPGAQPPFLLSLDRSPSSAAALQLSLVPATAARTFDPDHARDDTVLDVKWSMREHALGSQAETRYALHLTNQSTYYVVEALEVRARIALPGDAPNLRPDGGALLRIVPDEQQVRSIAPGATQQLDFLVVARGPAPGICSIDIDLDYRLEYREGRDASASVRVALPVRSIHAPDDPSLHPHLHRRHPMSEHHPAPKHRVLDPIVQRVALPGGGTLEIAYRLVKGGHANPEQASSTFGVNPKTLEIESHFSTEDNAALELTLRNDSALHLKHVYLAGIRLLHANPDSSPGTPADGDKLPDGNLLFEVMPNEVYFGHLGKGEARTKYLGLVTRGTESGHYFARAEVKYEIDDAHAVIDLALTVNPD